MNKSMFKTVVKDHIQKVSLTDKQLAELQHLIPSSTIEQVDKATPVNSKKWLWRNYALVASLGIIFGILLSQLFTIVPTKTDFIQEMALEVARNHRELIPLEVKSDSMNQLSNYFKGLTFKPIKTAQLDYEKIKISGGRYCSLNGITAAQIRLKRSGNPNIQTLYETEYREDYYQSLPNVNKGEKPLRLSVDGLSISAWIENGLVFAMTHEQ